ncbi:MAG: hypothetical protein H0X45_08850 [Planctomycetes bacterium]|nr:hypothetical protein [Planctomycetota bacterium]
MNPVPRRKRAMDTLPNGSQTRRGTALVAVATLSMTLGALALAVSEMSVSRLRDQQRRQDQFRLMASTESGLNACYGWLLADETRLTTMADGATIVTPTTGDTKPITDINGMPVVCELTCYEEGKRWRLRVQGTAGDRVAAPESYRRQMIEIAIARDIFSSSIPGAYADWGYEFKGSGNAGWWDSDPTYTSPEETSALAGDPSLPGTGPVVLASGNWLNVAKPENVDGQYGKVYMPMPTLNWTPSPAADSGALTTDIDLATGTSYHYAEWTGGIITVKGSGTVTVWIDGNIDYGQIGVKYDSADSVLKVRQGNPDVDEFESSKLNGNVYLGDVDGFTSDPRRFQIISEYDGVITLNGNAAMSAVLIAPNASLKLRGTFDFYGAMIVNKMEADKVTGNPSFYYDVNLADLEFPELSTFEMLAWRTQSIGYGAWRFNDATYQDVY